MQSVYEIGRSIIPTFKSAGFGLWSGSALLGLKVDRQEKSGCEAARPWLYEFICRDLEAIGRYGVNWRRWRIMPIKAYCSSVSVHALNYYGGFWLDLAIGSPIGIFCQIQPFQPIRA